MTTQKRPTQIIAVGNQKGGVGKTTTTVHLAAALGELGKKSLIIDLDANCGATRSLGVPVGSYQSSYDVLTGVEEPADLAIASDPDEGIELPNGVELIPSDRRLERVDGELANKHRFTDHRDCLQEPLSKLVETGVYDYVFLDTAPNIATPTVAAYRVADWFLLTATPDRLALEGLNDAMEDMTVVQRSNNAQLKLLGVVLSCVDRRTKLATALLKWADETFASAGEFGAFDTKISRAVAVPTAQRDGLTIFQSEPSHKVAEQYRQLARELVKRLKAPRVSASNDRAEPEDSAGAVING